MNNRRDRSSRWPRGGFTLVEVMAGILLLGTLLTVLVVANGRLAAQSSRSRQAVEAYRVLDDLVDRWWIDPARFPRGGEGPVAERPGWRWRTRVVPSPAAATLAAEVIHVEVFGPSDETRQPTASVQVVLARGEQEDAADETPQGPAGPDTR